MRLKSLARAAALSTLGNLTTAGRGPFLRLLYCHYVFDDQVRSFRAILKMLQEAGTFVDTDKCVSILTGGSPLDGRYFHLSFDDGFRNIFCNALPVLKELKVPAILFVPTALVGASWEEARQFSVERAGYGGVIEMVTWDDLLALKSWGFEVGSHTRTHARFTEMSGGRLDDELRVSKGEIEENLGSDCKYISWPYGRQGDADEASLEATRRAGYAACFGAFRGSLGAGGRVDRYRIPRHHFEPQWPLSHVRYFANGGMEERACA